MAHDGGGRAGPIVFLHESPASAVTTLRPLAEMASELGVRSVIVGRPGDDGAECGLGEGTPLLGFDSRRPVPARRGGRLPLLSPARAWEFTRQVGYWRAEARRIFQEHDPRAIISLKRSLEDVPLVTRLARRRGIPFVRVQWSFIMPQEAYDRQAPTRLLAQVQGVGRVQRAGYLLRQRILHAMGERLIPELNRHASASPGVTAFVATNQLFRDMFIADGLDPRTTVALGHPEDDRLWSLRKEYADPARVRELRTRLGWDPDGQVVLFVRTFLQSLGGLVTPEQDLAAVTETITAAIHEGARVVIRPHPKEDLTPLSDLRRSFPSLELDLSGDAFLSVAAADVVVGQGSGMTRWGVVLEKPSLLVDFAELEFVRHASELYRVPVARNAEQVRASMTRLLSGHRLVGQEDTRPVTELIDGNACQRILGLVGIRSVADEPAGHGDSESAPWAKASGLR